MPRSRCSSIPGVSCSAREPLARRPRAQASAPTRRRRVAWIRALRAFDTAAVLVRARAVAVVCLVVATELAGRWRGGLDTRPWLGVAAPMAELPSGTVTFLFSDIEGSTRLLTR